MSHLRLSFFVLILMPIVSFSFVEARNVNSSRKIVHNTSQYAHSIEVPIDTILVNSNEIFVTGVVTMKGFVKRPSDAKESFFLTNHTNKHLSLVEIKMRYTSLAGVVLHERVVQVPCDLPPFSTKKASVRSFDKEHEYYYYYGCKPRKVATPFKVSICVLRYDVVVRR